MSASEAEEQGGGWEGGGVTVHDYRLRSVGESGAFVLLPVVQSSRGRRDYNDDLIRYNPISQPETQDLEDLIVGPIEAAVKVQREE